MQNPPSFVEVHASRLHAGANNYVVLLGGFAAFASLVFAVIITHASRGVWITLAVFFVGLIAAIYVCGQRILAANQRVGWYEDRSKLAGCLLQLEAHTQEIDGMSATDFMTHMSGNATETLVDSIREKIRAVYGEADAAAFASKEGVKLTPVDPDHPLRGVETHRVNTVDYLRHYTAALKTIIAKSA